MALSKEVVPVVTPLKVLISHVRCTSKDTRISDRHRQHPYQNYESIKDKQRVATYLHFWTILFTKYPPNL